MPVKQAHTCLSAHQTMTGNAWDSLLKAGPYRGQASRQTLSPRIHGRCVDAGRPATLTEKGAVAIRLAPLSPNRLSPHEKCSQSRHY